ncbi:MAG: hypothetical protein ACI9LV_000055 [Candidatus Nanohaloarchaea archaeon]|jgi:hypothetical protein
MAADNTPSMSVRVVIGLLSATAALGIILTQSQIVGSSVSGHSGEFENFANNVNSVCENEQGTSRAILDIEEYSINRSQNDETQVMLVSPSEDIEGTATVECPITNEFRVSNSYVIERDDSQRTVTISEQYDGSQTGDIVE